MTSLMRVTEDQPGTDAAQAHPVHSVPPANNLGESDAHSVSLGALSLIVGLALMIRLLLAAYLSGMPLFVSDERDYDQLARILAEQGQYAYEPGVPTSLRPPLYPAMLAAIYRMAGTANYTAVRVVQAILGAVTVVFAYLVGRRLADNRTGLIAAAICALYPSLVAASGLLLTETLFTFLLVLGCLLCVLYSQQRRLVWLIAGSSILALAALTRSVLWLFPPLLAAWVLLVPGAFNWKQRLLHAFAAVAVFALVLTPWSVRNTLLHRTFVTVDVMGGRNFMMGNYEYTPLERPWDAISMEGEKAWHRVLLARYADHRPRTQGQLDKLALRYALEYIAQHPGQTVVRDVAKFFHFWQLEREVVAGLARGWWGNVPRMIVVVVAALITASYVVVLLSGIWGALRGSMTSLHGAALLIMVIAFVCGIHTLVFAHSRYHLPLMPLVAVFAARAWSQGTRLLAPNVRDLRFWLATVLTALMIIGWSVELLPAVRQLSQAYGLSG